MSQDVSAKSYVKQADDLVKQNETDSAIDCYRKAIELDPTSSPKLYKKLADALVKQQLLEEALELVQTAIARYPNNPLVYVALGNILVERGNPRNAIDNYQKSLQLNSKPPAWIYKKLGEQLLKQKLFAEAETIFQKLSTEHPENSQGYIGLARVAMSSLEWSSAQQRWDKVLELFPENITAFVGLGNTLIELKKYDRAEAIFQELSAKYPEKPQGYEGLANVAKATYQWQLALKWWDFSINKTRAKSSYLKKSRFLITHAHYETGFDVIDRLIAEQEKDLDLLRVKADLLISASRFHEASELLYQLQGQNPDSLPIQQLLSRALIGAHRFKEASQIIEKLPNYQDKSVSSYNDPDKMMRLLKTWQKYYKAGIDLDQPKIFGIGLSRTGTTSLTEALNLLGYVTIHFANPVTKKVIDLEDIFYYDAFTDSPIAFRFEELYFLFPNAKFIYTERKLVDWVNSSTNLYKQMGFGFSTTTGMKAWLTQPENGQFNKYYHSYHTTYRCAYESLYANYPSWEDAYHAFEKRVTKFFADKPAEKLLKLNICAGEGWEKLCKFLDVPVPAQSFPYYNKENAKSRPAS